MVKWSSPFLRNSYTRIYLGFALIEVCFGFWGMEAGETNFGYSFLVAILLFICAGLRYWRVSLKIRNKNKGVHVGTPPSS